MNDTKDCKVIFNTLIERMWKKNQDDITEENPLYCIEEIIKFIIKQKKTLRFFDLQGNKFCFLHDASIVVQDNNTTLITGLFKSARNEFRPNLIDKRTGEERRNPKGITEGDIEKTHFVILIDNHVEEVYFFLEYNFHGIHSNNVVNYFEHFHRKLLGSKGQKRNSTIKHLVIPKNNFLTELEGLTRTKLAEIYFDKKLLGSEALNFSNRYLSLKKELKLVAKASPHESITETVIDFFNIFNKKNSDISKVRVYGTDELNNEIILDTSFMSKVEFVNVDINQETGEVNSSQLFTGLVKIANSF